MAKYKPDFFEDDEEYARKSKKKESPRRRPDRNQKMSWDEIEDTAPIPIPRSYRK